MGKAELALELGEQIQCLTARRFGLGHDVFGIDHQLELEPRDPPVHPSGGIRARLQLVDQRQLLLRRRASLQRSDQLDEEAGATGIVLREQRECPLEQIRGAVGIAPRSRLRAGLAEPSCRAPLELESGRPSSRR